jgi:hypothetical protein
MSNLSPDQFGHTPQYRWMHHGEYTAAQEAGEFNSRINAAAGEPDHRYMAGDSMLIRFKGGEHWAPKEDNPAYSRALKPPRFSEAQIVQTQPMVPKDIPGPRPVKVDGRWRHTWE